jgi:hypothetical protein
MITAPSRVRPATGSGAGWLGTMGGVPGSLAIRTLIARGPRLTTLCVAIIVELGALTATASVSVPASNVTEIGRVRKVYLVLP